MQVKSESLNLNDLACNEPPQEQPHSNGKRDYLSPAILSRSSECAERHDDGDP